MAGKPKKPKRPAEKGKAAPKQPFAQLPPSLDIRKVGRPSKYDPSFCDLVIELGAQGKSKAQLAASIGVSRETVDLWAKVHPEFSDSLKWAKDLALAWWEDLGQMNICRVGFNATGFIFQMKNRFKDDYKDRHEVSGDPERPLVTKIVRTIVDPATT
jgi:hypothetical protein